MGATRNRSRRASPTARFNPHPPRRMGATYYKKVIQGASRNVSILTHPEGWVQRGSQAQGDQRLRPVPGFNPHPPRRMGATWRN